MKVSICALPGTGYVLSDETPVLQKSKEHNKTADFSAVLSRY